jgi:hypothetical protein
MLCLLTVFFMTFSLTQSNSQSQSRSQLNSPSTHSATPKGVSFSDDDDGFSFLSGAADVPTVVQTSMVPQPSAQPNAERGGKAASNPLAAIDFHEDDGISFLKAPVTPSPNPTTPPQPVPIHGPQHQPASSVSGGGHDSGGIHSHPSHPSSSSGEEAGLRLHFKEHSSSPSSSLSAQGSNAITNNNHSNTFGTGGGSSFLDYSYHAPHDESEAYHASSSFPNASAESVYRNLHLTRQLQQLQHNQHVLAVARDALGVSATTASTQQQQQALNPIRDSARGDLRKASDGPEDDGFSFLNAGAMQVNFKQASEEGGKALLASRTQQQSEMQAMNLSKLMLATPGSDDGIRYRRFPFQLQFRFRFWFRFWVFCFVFSFGFDFDIHFRFRFVSYRFSLFFLLSCDDY